MAVSVVAGLLADLEAEHDSLDRAVASLAAEDWSAATPAAGWDVRDCISHLCFFDEAAVTAVQDPDAFEASKAGLLQAKLDGLDADVDLGRAMAPADLLERWRRSRREYVVAARAKDADDPKARVPWYGPPMGLASFTTARLMETWAHGVDVKDALGLPIDPSDRLRHICHIGVGARAYSFAVHQMEDPGDPVRVTATDRGWSWGPEDAADRIEGTALDLALVFTQRRHVSRTSVQATGPAAGQWLAIAQAFAGPASTTAGDR